MKQSFANFTPEQGVQWWQADAARLAMDYGIHCEDVQAYLSPRIRRSINLAMDAQPALVTVSNAGIPAYYTNYMDPKLIEVLTSPNKAAEILGETKKGDWTTLTATFAQVESTGEVSSYGDWNNNGATGANVVFPARQSYHYQTITQWGERQEAMAGEAKIDWAAQLNVASAMVLDKYQTLTYFFGVAGLQNYGLLNDPSLSAALTPATKAASGTRWVSTGGAVVATPNEVYNDIQSLYIKLTNQTLGLVDAETQMVLAMSPQSAMALTAANSFNVNVRKLLEDNFPNLKIITAMQYATDAGQLMQLIATNINNQETGTCAFTEKMRAHPIIRSMSAYEQKKSQGTYGAIIFRPLAIAQMIGL